jgi:hypothetical protein
MLPRSFRATALAILGVGLLACAGTDTARNPEPEAPNAQLSPGPSTNAPLAQVDRLEVPDRIATADTLSIHLSGTVGPNGCYSLARIEEVRSDAQVTLRPVVQPPTRSDQACTMALVPLDTTHRVAPPFKAGTLTVTVPQSDKPSVTATVEITDDQ